ncbi:MAG: alpha/beta fold hydrolase [Neisseria sp.]|nr:alpha/beta fold hydrolase [Neisseria sp.]
MEPFSRKIVLLHGIFMHGVVMSPMADYLRRQGFECLNLSYPSHQYSLAHNAAMLVEQIEDFVAGEAACFVGHSLGGLLIRHLYAQAPHLLTRGCVVTLGTPHAGSRVANVTQCWHPFIVGSAWEQGLDGNAPALAQEIPLLSIAGTHALGVGNLCRIFDQDEANDGTVTVRETLCVEMSAHRLVHLSHTALIYRKEVYDLVCAWARQHIPSPTAQQA